MPRTGQVTAAMISRKNYRLPIEVQNLGLEQTKRRNLFDQLQLLCEINQILSQKEEPKEPKMTKILTL